MLSRKSIFVFAFFTAMVARSQTPELLPGLEKPSGPCGLSLVNDLARHVHLSSCLSRHDMLCLKRKVDDTDTLRLVPWSGGAGAFATVTLQHTPLKNTRVGQTVSQVVKGGWRGTLAGASYGMAAGFALHAGARIAGGALGFLIADEAGVACEEFLVHGLIGKRSENGPCEADYRVQNNPALLRLFQDDDKTRQLQMLQNPQVCAYFTKLNDLLKEDGNARISALNQIQFEGSLACGDKNRQATYEVRLAGQPYRIRAQRKPNGQPERILVTTPPSGREPGHIYEFIYHDEINGTRQIQVRERSANRPAPAPDGPDQRLAFDTLVRISREKDDAAAALRVLNYNNSIAQDLLECCGQSSGIQECARQRAQPLGLSTPGPDVPRPLGAATRQPGAPGVTPTREPATR